MKNFYPMAAFLISFLLSIAFELVAQPQASEPNVIIILTDDQGYGDYSVHGNPVLKTPNMDKLHSESVRLTDFHVAPMCTPTRGQLLTGMDAMRNGAVAVCQGRSMIRNGVPTMADYFAESGYVTGHFGKWHLGDSYPHRPQDRGFQETIHHPAWGITSLADHFGNTYWDPYLRHNGVEKKYEGYSTDIFFGEAMAWMKKKSAENKPFFLYLPTNTPHVPNWVDKEYSEPYRKIGSFNDVKIPADFYGMIANIDENLAKLEAFLNEEGLRDNTILIYLNDNGTQSRSASQIFNAGMRGYKTQMYEGGHRVGCFIRWPDGKLKHGTDVNDLTTVQDIFPTLIEFCKIDKKLDGDGVSLADVLTGSQTKLEDRKLIIQYSFQETSGTPWNRAIVLWNKWRLVGPHQLYDLNTDPHQNRSVIHEFPEVAQQMRDHYNNWYREVRPVYEQPRYIHIGNSNNNPVIMYGNDWQGGYCDNPGNLIAANTSGYWDVVIEDAGSYEIELRRWPQETGLALTASVEKAGAKALENFSGEKFGGRPIHSAMLKIADFEQSVTISADQQSVKFKTELSPGRTKLETLFADKPGMPLCSAIYVKVTKL